jgi:hypothetical protein
MSTNVTPTVTQEERELYEMMRHLPDFDCMPIPVRWFKEFNLPPRNPIGIKEFLRSNYTIKCAHSPKDLPPIRINKPQQDGKLATPHPFEQIDVETKTMPFVLEEGEEFPDVLPSLTEQSSTIVPLGESQD